MSYQVLARKWRPRRFEDLVGQGHVVKALSNALANDRLHHAYLFSGTRGVGKTTVARILARALNCESGVTAEPCGECGACREIDEGRFVDLIEVDAASRTKVDETRELLENVQYSPTRGRYKVYLIDEVHMFSNHSFNALLKTLEEPPPHVKFLLATTDPKKLPVTVLSRCLQFNLKRLGADEIQAQLARILEAEGISGESAALELLARAADGSVRDSLSLLDQAIAHGGGSVQADAVTAMLGTIDRGKILDLAEALADRDLATAIALVGEVYSLGVDPEVVLLELSALLQNIAMRQALGDADSVDADASTTERIVALAQSLSPEDCQLYYQIAITARGDLALAPNPKLGLEMSLLRMLVFQSAEQSRGGVESGSAPVKSASSKAGAMAAARQALDSAPAKNETAAAPLPAFSQTAAPDRAAPPAEPRLEPQGEFVDVPQPTSEAAGEMPAELRSHRTGIDWFAICLRPELQGLIRELAQNCFLAEASGDRLLLLHEPVHGHFRTPEREARLAEILRTCLDRHVTLEFRETQSMPGDTPVMQLKREQAEREAEAARAIAADPNVQTICQRFDASIEHTRPA